MTDLMTRVRDKLRGRDPIDIILDSPIGQKLLLGEAEKDERDRKAQGAIIDAAERDRAEKLPALDKAFNARKAAYDAAQLALKKADEVLQQAYAERRQFVHSVEYRITRAQRRLRELAPPEIAAAKAELAERVERVRKAGWSVPDQRTRWDRAASDALVRIVTGNRDSFSAWLARANELGHELDQLAESYVDDYGAACRKILGRLPAGPELKPLT